MRNREADEMFIRQSLKKAGIEALVYIAPNIYDGGYEVRVETKNVFVDYETIDAGETGWAYAQK